MPEIKDQSCEAVLKFAEGNHYSAQHSHQVAKLALKFFDGLTNLHRLGPSERSWLNCAGLLHDIGWVGGRQEHHKRSRDMIIAAKELPFSGPERIMIGLIARYHRRALPDDDHKFYADLDREDKTRIKMLASFLRIADGLDRSHVSAIEDLSFVVSPERVIVTAKAAQLSPVDREAGKAKADLFEIVFEREIVIGFFLPVQLLPA